MNKTFEIALYPSGEVIKMSRYALITLNDHKRIRMDYDKENQIFIINDKYRELLLEYLSIVETRRVTWGL